MDEVTNEKPGKQMRRVNATMNGRPFTLPAARLTGAQVKAHAMEQGISIRGDFQLSQLQNRRWKVIGDSELTHVHKEEQFLAVAPDDNS